MIYLGLNEIIHNRFNYIMSLNSSKPKRFITDRGYLVISSESGLYVVRMHFLPFYYDFCDGYWTCLFSPPTDRFMTRDCIRNKYAVESKFGKFDIEDNV